jgi:SAM-dependent methyltransferase
VSLTTNQHQAGIFDLDHSRTFCSVCRTSNVTFDPLPDFYRQNAVKHGYVHFGKGEMTAIETYSCGNCGASDRERLCAYWLAKELGSGALGGVTDFLHFAPEKGLANYILQSRAFGNYQTADLLMEDVDHKVDLTNLPFPDNTFDFLICNHVLEHVRDDSRAISELHRVLRPGGRGILLAPIIVGLKNTVEDSTATSEADCWRLFGQFDHVRLYAHDDYVRRIEGGDFTLQQLGHEAFGLSTFVRLGLKPTSILYIVTKK